MNHHHCISVLLTAALLLASATHAFADEASGTIRSVDAKSRTVVLRVDQKKALELTVSRKAKVVVDGKDAAIEALRPGQKATIVYAADAEIATEIRAASDANAPDEAVADLKWLEGEWVVVAERTPEGKQLTAEELNAKKKRLSIKGSKFTYSQLTADRKVYVFEGRLDLDGTTNPKQINWIGKGPNGIALEAEGIYTVDKDLNEFVRCFVNTGAGLKRPESFDSEGSRLEKFRRESKAAAEPQPGNIGKLMVDLSSTDPRVRITALEALGKLGAAAKPHASAIEKRTSDDSFEVRLAAVRALTSILGAEESARHFATLAQDTSPRVRNIAMIGLEYCGAFALPIVTSAIFDRDPGVRTAAVKTAAKIDVQGALNERILPMLNSERDRYVLDSVRMYILLHGIRRFNREQGRWPKDFAEAHDFIRKGNPLIDLSPLTKTRETPVTINPQPDGSLSLPGVGVFDGMENRQ